MSLNTILHSGKQGPLFYQQMWQLLIKNGQWSGDLWNKKKNGEIYHERLQINRVERDGDIIYVGIFSDLTEEDILGAKLNRAQKHEAIASLVAGIAHNFNNYLTAIIGRAFIGQRSATLNEAKPHLEDISAIAHQASDLIGSLMIFSHESERECQHFDFSSVSANTVRTASLGLPSGISLISEIGSDAMPVYAQQSQVEQIIFNLINNAKDAVLGQEDPQIEVALQRHKNKTECRQCPMSECAVSTEQTVTLRVSDNGHGIPEHIKERIFDPFFSTKPSGSGTGLGLSTAFKTVEQFGGTIFVNSEVGAGASFTVCLPLANQPMQPVGINPALSESSELPCRGETILIAEDDMVVLATIRNIVSEFGYNVISARNGMEAVELFSKYQDKVKLMITDVMMPIMNGDIAAIEIRNIQPTLPIIFMSGHSELDTEKGWSSAYTACLAKPVHPEILNMKITTALSSCRLEG